MKFVGLTRKFSTINNKQYEEIGAFWDEMAEKFGLENLIGLGYKWENNMIDYAIGLKTFEQFPESNLVIELPDESDKNWITEKGKTEKIDQLYENIYKGKHNVIKYELETFYEDGTCIVVYYKNEQMK